MSFLYNREKFGLFAVDFNSTHLRRIPKASAFYYKEIVRRNGFYNEPPKNTWGFSSSSSSIKRPYVSTGSLAYSYKLELVRSSLVVVIVYYVLAPFILV